MHGRVIGVDSRIQEATSANSQNPVCAYQKDWSRLAAGKKSPSTAGRCWD
jgi:hypothetical protein